MTNTLAIIAAGAMGSAIARRMAENGARVLTSLKGRSQATVDRAHQAGMTRRATRRSPRMRSWCCRLCHPERRSL